MAGQLKERTLDRVELEERAQRLWDAANAGQLRRARAVSAVVESERIIRRRDKQS